MENMDSKWTTAQFKLSHGSPYLKRWVYTNPFLVMYKAPGLKLSYLLSVLMLPKTHVKSCMLLLSIS